MNQAEVNARMLPWGERELTRFTFREALFRRRGLSPSEAETLADRLALRDQERDDRRVCDECAHLQRDGGCFAAAQGWMRNVSKRHQPVRALLQRCELFQFQTP